MDIELNTEDIESILKDRKVLLEKIREAIDEFKSNHPDVPVVFEINELGCIKMPLTL